ncbi:hypothetical protein HF882_01710 [Victivallis vadensis]|uniref:Uncharacterized protein n=1 Tax=Victivallis vadensis TaxID=172901 RepID=A0A848AST4_9BACT|nr:hypothetical protein [Victivallis vadensis]NMD85293.1 hypothetical protein [Victivallis vadensis]
MNRNKFKVELGKPGFNPPMFCDYRYPAGVLPKDCPYSIYCIVPVGTNRSKLEGHNHFHNCIPVKFNRLNRFFVKKVI